MWLRHYFKVNCRRLLTMEQCNKVSCRCQLIVYKKYICQNQKSDWLCAMSVTPYDIEDIFIHKSVTMHKPRGLLLRTWTQECCGFGFDQPDKLDLMCVYTSRHKYTRKIRAHNWLGFALHSFKFFHTKSVKTQKHGQLILCYGQSPTTTGFSPEKQLTSNFYVYSSYAISWRRQLTLFNSQLPPTIDFGIVPLLENIFFGINILKIII